MPRLVEIANKVDVIIVRLYCSTDNAQMESVGKMLPTNPPKYVYQCPVCKYKHISENQYPMLVYKEKEPQKEENNAA